MSRAHSTYIPADQVAKASNWDFAPVDQASLKFAAKVKAQTEAQDRARDEQARQTGYAEATLEGQHQITEYIANEGQRAAEHYASLFRAAQEQIEQSQQTLAKGVLELACELARQVLRRELTVNPNALQPVVREALGMLTVDTKMAAVRMNPVDLDAFAEDLQRECPNLQLSLVPDINVSIGGCLVEAAGTVIDGTVERRWNKVVASLGLESSWELADDAR
jgi:flagellar assembly protein FliH